MHTFFLEGVTHRYFGKSPDLWFIALLMPSQYMYMPSGLFRGRIPIYSGRTVQDFHLIPF